MAAPTFATNGSSSATTGASLVSSLSVSKPTGATSDNQMLVAAVQIAKNSTTIPAINSVPSNWSLAATAVGATNTNSGLLAVYAGRKADVGDGPYSWGFNTTCAACIGITTWDNADVVAPILSSEIAGATGNSTTSSDTAPSITTASIDRVIVRVIGNVTTNAITTNAIGGYTERYDVESSSGPAIRAVLAWNDKTASASGSQGTQAVSMSGLTFVRCMYTLAIQNLQTIPRTVTEAAGITDPYVYQKGNLQTNPLGITDPRTTALAKRLERTDAAGLSDSAVALHLRPATFVQGYFSI